MKRCCLILLWLVAGLGLVGDAFAQVELIVRPTPGAATRYAQAVDGFPAKAGPADAELFADVQAARSVVPVVLQPAKSGGAGPYAFTLSMADSAAYERVRARWSGRDDVLSVEPNAAFALTAAHAAPSRARLLSDPQADSLDHLSVIRAPAAWSITRGDRSVRIGLIDTGLQLDHPDLAPQLWINPGEDVNGNGRIDPGDRNGVDDDGNGWVDDLQGFDFVDRPEVVDPGDFRERDADPGADPAGTFSGHATAVAGAMSAAQDNGVGITGVAPGARLVPLRAFGGDGRGATDDIAAAVVYAAQMNLDVINLSFGRDFASPLLEAAIQYATARGTVVVASAGNNGGDEPHYPSDYPEAISVAWLNADGTDIAFRGEYGVGIDIGAPGTAIYTTLKPTAEEPSTPETLYGRQSGSSMAAPLVAGTAALLRSVDASLSPASIRSILTGAAVDIGMPGWDHRTAAGRLDVANALARALPARTAIDEPAHLGGTAAPSLPVVGTAIDPSFASYAVSYARGAEDLDDGPEPWIPLAGPVEQQALQDTLARFPAGELEEGVYTLRLVTTLQSGRTVEDRRRVYVDRSPPQLTPRILHDGLIGGAHGVVADVATGDLTTATMRVRLNGRTETVQSAVRNARHGLSWPDLRGDGGTARVRITATNTSGLTAVLDTSIVVPRWQANPSLLAETSLGVPHGILLPTATDFDGDGLREITFNQYERGALGDTLRAFEWDGAAFQPLDTLLADVIPRDVGDTNADGRTELLTQVGGATLLLEQLPGGGFPVLERFVDTTGLQNPGADDAVWGARLTDLDGDGQGEILSHNRAAWRVLEWTGTEYAEAARLDNPTSTAGADPAVTGNGFQQPVALVEDFDQDGRPNVLVGDNDGDWIMYEATGDDTYAVVWTRETRRIDAGARFGVGDFNGDGTPDFVTYTQNLPILTEDGAREPPVGVYYFWASAENDTYTLERTLPIQGSSGSNGSIAAADFDGDGRDEVALVHPPDVYVVEQAEPSRWIVRYHRGVEQGAPGLRSAALVAEDVTGDGQPDLVAGTADETFHLWQYQPGAASRPPPRWVAARAASPTEALLRWRAPQADSVTVWASRPDHALDPLRTQVDSSAVVEAPGPRRYKLQAWYAGTASPLSPGRVVRPHAPAVVEAVNYPSPQSVALRFSEPIARSVTAPQFQLEDGTPPSALLLQRGQREVVLRFDAPPTPRDRVLHWRGVRDADGVPVQQRRTAVVFPPLPDPSLIVASWETRGRQSVALTFNAPLDPETARDASHYRLAPRGRVAQIAFDPEAPTRVLVDVEGVVFGAVGESVTLRLTGLRSATGAALNDEGRVLQLVEPAEDLAEAFVFPNPHYRHRHDPYVTVAGLPARATVRILSTEGHVVRVLTERGQDGGLRWDLQDRNGRSVPSGVYLLHINAPNHDAILRKAAIVR